MSETDFSTACTKIDQEKDVLNKISENIWSNPEVMFKEVYAHDLLINHLEEYGFEVKRNYLLPTAFRAEYYSVKEFKGAKIPVIAVLLEYDALPVIGHGCGHNLIAEAGLAAGLGVKAALDADPTLVGKIVLLGTPAEEGGGGKVLLMNAGAFEDIDAAMMVHPRRSTIYSPQTLCKLKCTIDFKGKESHASAFPWEGVNALDAAVSFYQSVGLMRQQIRPTCRLHAIITKGGTAPNIIPAESQLVIYIRAATKKEVYELKFRIENCVKGAALSTGCSYNMQYDEKNCYENLITNPVMANLYRKFSESQGLLEAESSPRGAAGSTDMGNVSHVLPSIHPIFGIDTEAANHSKEFTAAAASPRAQKPTLIAAKSMAMTVLSIFRNPDILNEANTAFENQRLH